MNKKLLDLLSLEAEEIRLSFEKASIEGQGTPQEVSDRREGAFVNVFLAKYFPFPYRIVKGNIIDSYGASSNSIDCIVLNPAHPYTVDPKNQKASIIFADGVDYVIEVKPDLSSKSEIERSLKQIRSVKKLRRKKHGMICDQISGKKDLEYYYQLPCFIFSSKTYSNLHSLLSVIADYYINENVPTCEQFDYMVINSNVIIYNSRKQAYCSMNQNGLFFVETKDNTLAAMLFLMIRMPQSEILLGHNVMEFYIDKNVFGGHMQEYSDINDKLDRHFKIY